MKDHVRVAHPNVADILGIPVETLGCPYCVSIFRNSREDNVRKHVINHHPLMLDDYESLTSE